MHPRILGYALACGISGLALFAAGCGDHEADRGERIRLGPGTSALDAASARGAGIPVGEVVPVRASGELPRITVYKSPTCGCCSAWEDHLRRFGFAVESIEREDMVPVKLQNQVPGHLSSCHTAIVDGYVIEGHVPADLIERLVTQKPAVLGLTVPGMPMGSPGMEGPYKDPYDVLTFDRDGATTLFARR
jgi:hypothetical protein